MPPPNAELVSSIRIGSPCACATPRLRATALRWDVFVAGDSSRVTVPVGSMLYWCTVISDSPWALPSTASDEAHDEFGEAVSGPEIRPLWTIAAQASQSAL